MRRMRRIPLQITRLLKHRNKPHIEALCARDTDRERPAGLERDQTRDFADHALGDGCPVLQLCGCHALFEAEEDCILRINEVGR